MWAVGEYFLADLFCLFSSLSVASTCIIVGVTSRQRLGTALARCVERQTMKQPKGTCFGRRHNLVSYPTNRNPNPHGQILEPVTYCPGFWKKASLHA